MKKKFTQTGALLLFLSMLVLFVTYKSKSPATEIAKGQLKAHMSKL